MTACPQSNDTTPGRPTLEGTSNSVQNEYLVKRRCILVADDDLDDLLLLRIAFRKARLWHQLIHVADGEAALAYLNGAPPFDDRLLHPLPDLFLLDLKMPKVNGFDVLAALKGFPYLEGLPIVVLSSSSLQSDKEFASRLGAREFVSKPNCIPDMIEMVRGLHERWLNGSCANWLTASKPLAVAGDVSP